MGLLAAPSTALQCALVGQIRRTFNDTANGERPVAPSDHALFPRESVVWRVHGDVTSMMVGGLAALLVQMLHPAALAGVWDHSDVGRDQLGRLRRTARFIAVTTFGDRDAAEQAIARVRSIHARLTGVLPNGTSYRVDDPALLAWVHVAGCIMFLDAWRRYGEPRMSRVDQDRYFAESGVIAEMLGADPVPRTRCEAQALIDDFRSQLRFDDRTREFQRLVLEARPADWREAPVQRLLTSAAVDVLPPFAKGLHGFRGRWPAPPLVRAATAGIAGTLRWAFAGERARQG
jgi:uncharacterized protein (DUF2236 family)